MSSAARPSRLQPPALPGFSHIARAWDPANNAFSAKILPGEYYVTTTDEIITTVLGSCVSACIRDPDTGVGGMNHFMLPGNNDRDMDKWGNSACLSTRYGVAAMEMLINDILKLGSKKNRLEVKLFGGGEVLQMETNNVGKQNVQFVQEFISAEGLSVKSADLGGPHPRKVNFSPKTGKVMMRRLRALHKSTIVNQEKNYANNIQKPQATGGIDLF